MQMYTFYPYDADGASPSFMARELASDEAARAVAEDELVEHRSCAYVVVWADERLALKVVRAGEPCDAQL